MKIDGKVHCFFKQSGTFKNEFLKLGIPAEDYDIQNNFGETNHVIDLFTEIENCYDNKPSVFDSVSRNDLIMSFFPCIYFETIQMCYYQCTHNNNRHKPMHDRVKDAIDRIRKRTEFHILLYKLVYNVLVRNHRLIIENPATTPSFLIGSQNFPNPTIIDKDRTKRGDMFKKPTAYWFFNCVPTQAQSIQVSSEIKTILNSRSAPRAGLCSEERSMISPDYARNFIADFILGKPLGGRPQQQDLFATSSVG